MPARGHCCADHLEEQLFSNDVLERGLGDFHSYELEQGESVTLETTRDFAIDATAAVALMQVISSQGATSIPSKFPGGDPSSIVLPPVEQFRQDYVFITLDRYALRTGR